MTVIFLRFAPGTDVGKHRESAKPTLIGLFIATFKYTQKSLLPWCGAHTVTEVLLELQEITARVYRNTVRG